MKSADRGGGKAAPLCRSGGFTLIELMVTVAIGAIVLALAVPAFTDLIARNRMTAAVNTFIANLQLARSEAVKRGIPVSLCPSSGGASCLGGANANEWHRGYIVFPDPANPGTRQDNADEPILRYVQGAADAAITIKTASAGTITYQQNGTSPFANDTYTFCDTADAADPRAVILSNLGRPRVSNTKSNGDQLDCS